MRPKTGSYFCFTLDTEPDDLWVYNPNLTFHHFQRLFDFHVELCERGARPVYLTTSEVAENRESARVMDRIVEYGNAEIGAHFHSWTREWPFDHPDLGNPPKMAMAHRLGQAVEEGMLEYTCKSIEKTFGARPKSYRGGRWSFNGDSVKSLTNCGIHIDTTVTPGRTWQDPTHLLLDGPDYRGMPRCPFYMSRGSMDPSFEGGDIIEFPVGASPAKMGGAASARHTMRNAVRMLAGRAKQSPRSLWLRPTSMSTPQLRACVDILHEDGIPVWVAMIHSSEIISCNKLPTESDVQAFRARCLDLVEYAVSRGAVGATLSELGGIYGVKPSIRSLNVG